MRKRKQKKQRGKQCKSNQGMKKERKKKQKKTKPIQGRAKKMKGKQKRKRALPELKDKRSLQVARD